MPVSAQPSQIGSRALTGAAWMVSFRIASRLLGIVSTLILARLLNTTDFGIVAIAFTISAAFNSLSNVGVTENLVRHHQVGRDVLDTGFTVQVIKGALCACLVVVAAPFASLWYDDPRLPNVMYALGAAFAFAGFENVGIIHFRRELRFDREFQLAACERVSMFVATVVAALLLRNYWALVIGTLVSKLVRVGATYAMHPYRPRFGLKAWHELAGFSLWMWFSSLAYIVWQRADPLVIGSAVSKAELGLFVVALDIALLPTTEILEPIAGVLFAGFAAERNAGGDPRQNAFRLAVTLVAIMAPIALVLSAAGSDIVAVLLGPKWSAAGPLVAVLTLSVLFSPFSVTASIVLTAIGKLKANFSVVTLASIAKLVLLSVASRTGSLHVIALAAVAITSIESSLFVIILHRNGSRIQGLGGPIVRIVASLALGGLALAATGLAWAGDAAPAILEALLRGIVLAVVGLGVYGGAMLGLWHAVGRPDGPERQIIGIGLPFLAKLWTRVLGRKQADA